MKNYFDFSHFKGDLLGGLTAGIVALPLALAFGVQSGLGAAAGLYGAIFIGFFAALFGGTNTQISGPTAPMTAVSMLVISGILAANNGDPEKAYPFILTVFLLAGLFQILLGALRVGKYIHFIPYPVVSGFMTGIGVIIIVTQVLPMMGYYPKEDSAYIDRFTAQAEEAILERILREEAKEGILVLEDFEETVRRAQMISKEDIDRESKVLAGAEASGVLGAIKLFKRAFKNINQVDLALCLLTILIVYGFKRITTTIPSALVALLSLSIGAYFILPEYRDIGAIPSGFPAFQFSIFSAFSFEEISPYIFVAASLAILGAIDSLLTSIVADNLTKTKHNPNQELLGQGIGNSIAAFFGGLPGAGATIRTVVNINAGGRTRISGMIAGVLLLLVLLLMGPLASQIPAAVLAGILITVGFSVMDFKGLKHLKDWPLNDAVVMLLVLVLTVFVGLIEAVAAGMIFASILFMKKISDVIDGRTRAASLDEYSHEISWDDEGDIIDRVGERVFISHLDGPLFFGFASRFQDMVNALPEIEVVIIRMARVPYIDQSGVYAMEDAILGLEAKGIKVVLTSVQQQPLDMLLRFNLIPDLVKIDYLFESFNECITWLEGYLKEKDIKHEEIIGEV